MAAISIHSILLPGDQYRLDLYAEGFETVEASRGEDTIRVRRIESVMRQYPDLHPVAFAELKKVLSYPAPRVPKSMASHRYMRRMRLRILGQLWRTWHLSGYDQVAIVHIIPRGWDLTPDELAEKNPNRLMDSLRTDLNKAGAGGKDGYLAAFIDGELDATSGRYQLHVHAVVAGGMLDAVEGLRAQPKYASGGDPDRLSVYRRIVVIKRRLSNMPYPLTSILKSYWHWAIELEKAGVRKRCKLKSRMPEPYHSLYLLWLHRWGLGDISLLMGLRVGKDGFILTRTPDEIHE